MRLTVLGCHGPVPGPGGACSGYLLESGDTRLVCDLGSGTLSRLMALRPLDALSGIVLSHLHFDHCSDVPVLRYALEILQKQGRPDGRLPLYAPKTPESVFGLFSEEAFALHEIRPGMTARIGAFTLTFHPVRHPVEAYAVTAVDPAGRRLFYTGDTGWFDGLPELARGADVILADTAFLKEPDTGATRPHMTIAQAARLAREAHAGRLLCTHLPGMGNSDEIQGKDIDFVPATVVQELGCYEFS